MNQGLKKVESSKGIQTPEHATKLLKALKHQIHLIT